jgi:DNA-binding PadR family transcriptional regulator
MEKDGAVYGYALADRIAQRTGGGWRPGPGAVYPALQRLTDRGLAEVHVVGRRREFRITPRGRLLLRKVRKERSSPGGSGPDLTLLWAEIMGAKDDSAYLLQRLRRTLDGIETYLDRELEPTARRPPLHDSVLSELRAAERRLRESRRRAPPTRARRRPDP